MELAQRDKTMSKKYDYIIVGSGLFGSVFACEMHKKGKKVLVLEKREHIGGNIYSKNISGIDVHKYGPHIFHTNNKAIWEYINNLAFIRPFVYSPLACYKGEFYNLPFNMNTFYQMWKVKTPDEAIRIIENQKAEYKDITPSNLEEQALQLVGSDIYGKLIKGYTEKQWGRSAKELPAFIINRIPVRMRYDNNYFDDIYQGIPLNGYTEIIKRLLQEIEVKTNVDFLQNKAIWQSKGDRIVFTGRIDEWFDECFGKLEYRSLRFEDEEISKENYQGVAVINYTEINVPFTRITEHKHFANAITPTTVITKEYPQEWNKNCEPYYPVNNEKNNLLYEKYFYESQKLPNVIFGGRLGEYKYYNMDQVIEKSLEAVNKELNLS